MALPEKDVPIDVKNLFNINKFLLEQTGLEYYSSFYFNSYYFGIDLEFFKALYNSLIQDGYIEGLDFGSTFINNHYRFTLVSSPCTIKFIEFHNLFYLFNPIPYPFDGLLFNSEFFSLSGIDASLINFDLYFDNFILTVIDADSLVIENDIDNFSLL